MTSKHLHKYKKEKLGHAYWVFRCMMPDCSHYLPVKLAIGRISICWRCSTAFVMTGKHIKLTRPHCDECTKSTGSKIEITDEDVARILGDTLENL